VADLDASASSEARHDTSLAGKCLLLTGGTGFVGRHLAPRLAKAFPHMRHVMIARTSNEDVQSWDRFKVDLADADALTAAVGILRPAMVVHMAAQSSVGQASQAAELTWRINTLASLTLAAALARHAPAATVLLTSTAEVYGASFRDGPARETTPAAPGNSYAISKLAAEQIFHDILPGKARLIVARAFNHSGRGQDERFVLPSWAAQIARAEAGFAPATIKVGNLSAARDFLHVEDVVDAYVSLLNAAPRLGLRTTVNVASGKAVPLQGLLDGLRARAKRSMSISKDPARMRPSDIPIAVGDIERLSELTGWRPVLGIDRILDDVLDEARIRCSEDAT
jgi:GDP-4-dehydro-6-deoxy-D-mannose reductase